MTLIPECVRWQLSSNFFGLHYFDLRCFDLINSFIFLQKIFNLEMQNLISKKKIDLLYRLRKLIPILFNKLVWPN